MIHYPIRFIRLFPLFLLSVALAFMAGCVKRPGQAEAEDFFVDWLQNHGEKDVVRTADGVGVEGNATRLRAWIYNTQGGGDKGYSVETEFRILLPDQREIVEFVAGIGATKEEAFRDSLVNFMVTTFHPIYRSFINPEDPHLYGEQILINGRQRELIMGDVHMLGSIDGDQAEINALRTQLRRALVSLPLKKGPHWIKIVYVQVNGKALTLTATLDNNENRTLTKALANLDWPRKSRTYILKQFIVIK